MKRNAGFTLIELLVGVALMVILLTAITLIFFRSTDVVKINDARISIYENARGAMDRFASDWENQQPVSSGRQSAHLADFTRPPGSAPAPGSDWDGAADYAGWATTAPVPSGATRELKSVYVEYFLTLDDDAETSATGPGSTKSLRSRRPIYVLKRRVWALPAAIATLRAQQAAGVPITEAMPGPLTATSAKAPGVYGGMTLIEDADLCHWVVSFDIEVLEYAPSAPPGPANPGYHELDGTTVYVPAVMPLGDAPGAEPEIPRKVRISLRVIEGAAERQERLVQREVWTAAGGN